MAADPVEIGSESIEELIKTVVEDSGCRNVCFRADGWVEEDEVVALEGILDIAGMSIVDLDGDKVLAAGDGLLEFFVAGVGDCPVGADNDDKVISGVDAYIDGVLPGDGGTQVVPVSPDGDVFLLESFGEDMDECLVFPRVRGERFCQRAPGGSLHISPIARKFGNREVPRVDDDRGLRTKASQVRRTGAEHFRCGQNEPGNSASRSRSLASEVRVSRYQSDQSS